MDPVHRDIKMIITMQYHTYPPLRALATEMALKAVKFISAIVGWVDNTYESLFVLGNIKEDV